MKHSGDLLETCKEMKFRQTNHDLVPESEPYSQKSADSFSDALARLQRKKSRSEGLASINLSPSGLTVASLTNKAMS